ncbi:MAG TPA: hypothetical protein PK040_08220 [Anaerolineaceae bacterium]|nr:hypothetical protein [Anaerolineaceae bacterium]
MASIGAATCSRLIINRWVGMSSELYNTGDLSRFYTDECPRSSFIQ